VRACTPVRQTWPGAQFRTSARSTRPPVSAGPPGPGQPARSPFRGHAGHQGPARRQTLLVGVIPALAVAALLAAAYYGVAFHPDSFGNTLGQLSIAILLVGGVFLGRRLRSVICTLVAVGLYFVFVKSSILVASDYVLEIRGQQLTAVVVETVQNPTGCAAVSAFYSSINPRSPAAKSVSRLDGTPLPGAIGLGDKTASNRHVYRDGEHVEVLVDPDNAVCMRAKSEVNLVVDTIAVILAAGCIASVFTVAPLDRRNRRQDKHEAWRAKAF
jgi:hypothetical protein